MLIDTNSPFYAAVAIGSTKVTGMVGRVDSEGAVNVLSYVAVSSADFIRKGRVYNVDKMTQCLKNIRKRLEDQINCDIKQVYVALNCQGMRSITHIEERTFPQRITVQQELIAGIYHGRLLHHRTCGSNDRPHPCTILEHRVQCQRH